MARYVVVDKGKSALGKWQCVSLAKVIRCIILGGYSSISGSCEKVSELLKRLDEAIVR
jgi:hypothetical protein